MYLNSGYLNNSLVDFKDKSRPLIVGSCGTYRPEAAHVPAERQGGFPDSLRGGRSCTFSL